jgi:hypothetical protein
MKLHKRSFAEDGIKMIQGAPAQGPARIKREEGLNFMELSSRVTVALSSAERAHTFASCLSLGCHIVEPQSSECNLIRTDENSVSFSLEEILRLDITLQNLEERQAHRILVCTGFESCRQAKTLMLLGCHMVLSQGMAFEEAFLIFRPLHSLIQTYYTGISAFEILLRAMCCAKCLNWIDFGLACNSRPKGCIQINEFFHYAR